LEEIYAKHGNQAHPDIGDREGLPEKGPPKGFQYAQNVQAVQN
jgi:hypothetical protein